MKVVVLQLRWTERQTRGPRFLDFIVEGRSVSATNGGNLLTPLGWGSVASQRDAVAALTLQRPGDVGERVVLYVCPECGDLQCGALTVRVRHEGDLIVWSDLRDTWIDGDSGEWQHDLVQGLQPWHERAFDAAAYRATLAAALTVEP